MGGRNKRVVGVFVMTLTTLDTFNLIASIASIILAVVAIVLSVLFYFASKNAEVKTTLALNNLEQATNTINSVSMRLLNKLTNYVISPNQTEQRLIEVISELKTAPLKDTDEAPNNPTKAQLEQFRVDNLIAAMYYASIANSSLQMYLPIDIGQLPDAEVISKAIDQSKQDYFTLKSWINNAGDDKLNNSPFKHMYDEALTVEPGIRNTAEVYASRQGHGSY